MSFKLLQKVAFIPRRLKGFLYNAHWAFITEFIYMLKYVRIPFHILSYDEINRHLEEPKTKAIIIT